MRWPSSGMRQEFAIDQQEHVHSRTGCSYINMCGNVGVHLRTQQLHVSIAICTPYIALISRGSDQLLDDATIPSRH